MSFDNDRIQDRGRRGGEENCVRNLPRLLSLVIRASSGVLVVCFIEVLHVYYLLRVETCSYLLADSLSIPEIRPYVFTLTDMLSAM